MDYSHTRVRLTPVPSSGETAWLLRGNDNTIIFSGGPYDILSGLVRETVAVKESATYELLLRDSFGDGIFSGSIIVYLGDGSNTADDRALLFLDGGFRRFISGKFVADDAGILPDFALASFAPTSLFAPLPFSPAPSVTPTTRAPSISPAPSRTKVDVTVRLSFDVEAVSDWKELKYKNFDQTDAGQTGFFATNALGAPLFGALSEYLGEREINYKVSENTWKMTFDTEKS